MEPEILFRGKRLDNGEWVYGMPATFINLSGAPYAAIIPIYSFANDLAGLKSVDPATIGRYTGLTDKNGVKIFEGDIVSCAEYECCGYIAWNESEAGFYFQVLLEDGKYEEEQMYDYAGELEVIGNIFDNPALLEESEK